MKLLPVIFAAIVFAAGSAQAQTPAPPAAERLMIEVSRADLAVIAQGVMKLPYEQAAPILNNLQKQLDAQAPKPAEEPKPEKK